MKIYIFFLPVCHVNFKIWKVLCYNFKVCSVKPTWYKYHFVNFSKNNLILIKCMYVTPKREIEFPLNWATDNL